MWSFARKINTLSIFDTFAYLVVYQFHHIFYFKFTWIILWFSSSLFLQTFNISNVSSQCPDAECLFAFYGGETLYHNYLILFQFYNVFLFFWCANFVTALGQVTLSGAFASYYWAFKKPDDIPAFPIFASLGRALRLETQIYCIVVQSVHLWIFCFITTISDDFMLMLGFCFHFPSRYHTGSLAFGSLILSIVQVIRVLLEYLDHKLKGQKIERLTNLITFSRLAYYYIHQ